MNQDIAPRQLSTSNSFINFLLKDARNRRFIRIAAAATIFEFILFKIFYPFPDFFSDSYSYIYAASANLDISIWPIGYSKFLLAFHWFTHSDTALIGFQYFLLETASLYFFFTIAYLYNLARVSQNILFGFLVFNPLFLYLSNYVNSDSLFASLSILWLTQLLWIIHRPRIYQLFTQSLLLFACFTVRNNAYFYPIVTILAFSLSIQSIGRKLSGMALGIVFILAFITYERDAAFRLTGTHQFSLFTGWQLANNALYIYDKIKVDSTKLPTAATRELDQLSREFVKSIPPKFKYREYLQYYVGNYFIRQPDAPLKNYLWSHYTISGDSNQVESWGKASVVFADYGGWILKHYPLEFARYFIIPNARNYFLPPLEKLEIYNLGLNDVPMIVEDWFDYKTPDVWSISKKIQRYILFILPPLFLVLNLLFASSLVWLLLKRKRLQNSTEFNKTIWLNTAFLLLNFGFSVFATINVFRYQFFPMILCLTSSLLLIGVLDKRKSAVGHLPIQKKNRSFEKELITVEI